MDFGLVDKVVLITGSGSQIGIGKAVAIILVKEGCNIISYDIGLEGAKRTANEVKTLGRKALAFKTDVSKK